MAILELAHGITRSDSEERRERRQRFMDDLATWAARSIPARKAMRVDPIAVLRD